MMIKTQSSFIDSLCHWGLEKGEGGLAISSFWPSTKKGAWTMAAMLLLFYYFACRTMRYKKYHLKGIFGDNQAEKNI